ncbi:MAG: hypothetical protein WCC66_13440, partial [Rhizobiaceae bacterium]
MSPDLDHEPIAINPLSQMESFGPSISLSDESIYKEAVPLTLQSPCSDHKPSALLLQRQIAWEGGMTGVSQVSGTKSHGKTAA